MLHSVFADSVYCFTFTPPDYVYHIVWKLLEVAWAACFVRHSLTLVNTRILGQAACVSRCGNGLKQLNKLIPHRAMWKASSVVFARKFPKCEGHYIRGLEL